jgi:hypothetical protein
MILPSKHLSQNRALLTVGAVILRHMSAPITVSSLWESVLHSSSDQTSPSSLRYDAFVLALDLLFFLGAIELHEGLLARSAS